MFGTQYLVGEHAYLIKYELYKIVQVYFGESLTFVFRAVCQGNAGLSPSKVTVCSSSSYKQSTQLLLRICIIIYDQLAG